MSAGIIYIPRAKTSSKAFLLDYFEEANESSLFESNTFGATLMEARRPRSRGNGCRIGLVWQVLRFLNFNSLIVITRLIYAILLLFYTAQLRAWRH